MAVTISGKDITLSRGDYTVLTFTLTDSEGAAYNLTADDTVVFTVKRSEYADPAIEKEIAGDGTNIVTVTLLTADTEGLDFTVYVYDIRIKLANGHYYTPFAPAKFTVAKVVGNNE